MAVLGIPGSFSSMNPLRWSHYGARARSCEEPIEAAIPVLTSFRSSLSTSFRRLTRALSRRADLPLKKSVKHWLCHMGGGQSVGIFTDNNFLLVPVFLLQGPRW